MSGSTTYNLRLTTPIWILTFIIICIASIASEPFRSPFNITTLLSEIAPLLLVATGQAIVILLAGVDLSVGSLMSLSTVLAASYSTIGGNGTVNTLLILLVGLVVGAINGTGIILGINPLIMTLSTMAIVKGMALFIMPSPGGTVAPDIMGLLMLNLGIIPFFFLLALLTTAIIWFVTSETRWGRRIYAVGFSAINASRSGINTKLITLSAYMLSGLLASIAGLALVGRIFSGDPLVGDPYTLDAITVAVLGGIALTGGKGSLLGVLPGAVLLALIDNVLNMLNVFSYYQYIAKGLILIAALCIYNMNTLRTGTPLTSFLCSFSFGKK